RWCVSGREGWLFPCRGGGLGGGEGGAPPGTAAGGLIVVVAEAGPEHDVAEEVLVRSEELRVEVRRYPGVVDHVAGVQEEIRRRLLHRVADRELRAAGAARVARHQEGHGEAGVVDLEERLVAQRGAVGERRVAGLPPPREARQP